AAGSIRPAGISPPADQRPASGRGDPAGPRSAVDQPALGASPRNSGVRWPARTWLAFAPPVAQDRADVVSAGAWTAIPAGPRGAAVPGSRRWPHLPGTGGRGFECRRTGNAGGDLAHPGGDRRGHRTDPAAD